MQSVRKEGSMGRGRLRGAPGPDDFLQAFSDTGRGLFLAAARRRELAKREALFHEGDCGSAVYVLERGRLQVYKLSAEGREISIRVIRPGELFGEVVLFETSAYPATAAAIVPSAVLCVSVGDFERLLDRREFRNEFIRILLRKERYLAERIRELTSAQVEERFVSFLRQHYGESASIAVSIPKRDVASSIGATPETFSRMLTRLKEEEALTWDKGNLRVDRALWERWRPS
jgi:CRP-like cAMP-binding protein